MRTSLFLALLAGVFISGCGRKEADSPFVPRPVDTPIPLEVVNNNFLDVTIYAVGSGASHRLGAVTGMTSGRFAVDPRRVLLASGIQLRVEPVGSRETYWSPMLYPDGRSRIVLTVAAVLNQSHVVFRSRTPVTPGGGV